jgi:hypothetical protein
VGFDALVTTLDGRTRPRARAVLTSVACALLVVGSLMTREFETVTGQGRDGNFGYRAIGLWTRDRFPAGTVIGAKQSGAIGYYAADCDVVNLDGVVNRDAFRALTERRMLDWLGEQGIETFVLWDYGADFLRHFSREPRTRDFKPVETVPDIHSWGDPGTNAFRVFRLE